VGFRLCKYRNHDDFRIAKGFQVRLVSSTKMLTSFEVQENEMQQIIVGEFVGFCGRWQRASRFDGVSAT
jgi:hypothetical protein